MSNSWGTKYDNEVLVDFDIMIDLDMAIYKYIRKKYKNNKNVYQEIISLKSEYDAIFTMINRQDLNPLSLLIKNNNDSIDKLYNSIIKNSKNDLLFLAKPTDILYLMNTFRDNASSINITVHCNDDKELEYFNNISKLMNLNYKIICSSKQETSVKDFTAIYIKNFIDIQYLKDLKAKNIYIANTLYNIYSMINNIDLAKEISVSNKIRTIDMYTKVKAGITPDILKEIDNK